MCCLTLELLFLQLEQFIGIIAFKQNDRANDISDRLLKLQEVNVTPFLHLDISGCRIQCFRESEIDILLGLRNETNSVINIIEVSQIKADLFLSKQLLIIPFCKGWSNYYLVLPHETKQINFFNETKRDDEPLADLSGFKGFMQFKCELEIKLHFVNSNDIYIQKLEFYLHIYSPKGEENNGTNYKLNIFSVDNNIEKKNNG